jgi:hypothetical protein
MNIYDKKTLSL